MDELRISSDNPPDRDVETLLISAARSIREEDDNLCPLLNINSECFQYLHFVWGLWCKGRHGMHLLFQFFLVFPLLLHFLLLFAVNYLLPMQSDVAEWLVLNLCEDNWTDIGCKDQKKTTKFNGRDAGTDGSYPRLAHRWPIGTHKNVKQLYYLIPTDICRSVSRSKKILENRLTHFHFTQPARLVRCKLAASRLRGQLAVTPV